jgi:hypothetical protein
MFKGTPSNDDVLPHGVLWVSATSGIGILHKHRKGLTRQVKIHPEMLYPRVCRPMELEKNDNGKIIEITIYKLR